MTRFEIAKPLLQAAIDRSEPGQTIEDVEAEVIAGNAMFWPGKRSAAVTQLTDHRAMNVWLAAGDIPELLEMETAAAELARKLGCNCMTVENGREGWERVLKSRGYRTVTLLIRDL